jgi:hypothetical protein
MTATRVLPASDPSMSAKGRAFPLGGHVAADVVAEARYPVDQAFLRQYPHGLAGRLTGMALLAAQYRDRRELAARCQLPVPDLLADESGKPHIRPRIWLPCCRHIANNTRVVSKIVDHILEARGSCFPVFTCRKLRLSCVHGGSSCLASRRGGTIRWRRVVTMTVAAVLPLTVVAAAAQPASAAGGYTVTATIGVGSDPEGVAVDPFTHTAYVTNRGNTVSVISGYPVPSISKTGARRPSPAPRPQEPPATVPSKSPPPTRSAPPARPSPSQSASNFRRAPPLTSLVRHAPNRNVTLG